MIYILDKEEDIVGVLSNDNPNACPYFDDLLKESLEDFRLTYEFKVPSNHDTAELIEEGGHFIRKGLDGELLMFRIKIVEEDHSDINTKYIYGESAGLELLYTVIRPTNQTAVSAENALAFLLAESRWSIGTVEVGGTTNLVYEDYATALQRLLELATAFSGELRFRVEIDGGKVSGRYVDLLERRGSDTGKQFTYDKDIKSIKRNVDMNDIVTALIGVGKGDDNGNYITFKDVTWSTANGDPVDKPPGQDWVGDDEAAAQWGVDGRHQFGIYQCDSENGIDLLNKTWDQLKTVSQPAITYELDVALLEYLAGYEHERVRLGDTVVVYDKTFSPVILVNARVQSLEISFTNPENNKVTLSNFTQAKTNITAQILALQSKLNKKEMAWDSAKELANAAQQAANEAQQTANNANQTASVAQETASNAQTAASNAQQSADAAQQTAENAQESATNAENTANNALETANQAQEAANSAQTTANNAMTAANGKNTVYRQPTPPTGTFATGDLWFDTANGNRVSVWDGSQWVPSQFGSMAISNLDAGVITTGILDADKVTVKNLEADSIKSLNGLNINDQFVVDSNGNVTFKGNLAGATGTFSGNINTSSDVNVGNNMNLGNVSDYSQKKITFNDRASISSDGTLLSLRGPNTITLANNNGASIEMDGNTVNIGGILSADGYIYVNPEKLLTSSVETGNCGVAGINSIGTSGVFAGVWVPFRVRKTYTPASVTLTTGSHNLSSLAGVQTTNATINGFWLYLTGQTTEQIYRYWRGTYSA